MNPTYDVIVIGAGSVGVPAAMHLAAAKLKVLVIDSTPSAGQGQNKRAIGGIRATHSDEAKILACQQSLSIFSSWEETHGDNIEWQQGGYSYPAYNEETEKSLKDLLKIQKSFDLDIAWIGPDEYSELVPGIARENLRGSTYSPGDGSASPMLAGNAFYRKSLGDGAAYHFGERVVDIIRSNGKVTGVQTDQGRYCAKYVVNAAGAQAGAISRMAGLDLPVRPDCHEGGITEPVQPFFKPMVVDLRKAPGSKNFYFYQNREGQVVFCITPDPPIWGIDEEETSQFLPMVARRMIELFPKLKNLKVRRT